MAEGGAWLGCMHGGMHGRGVHGRGHAWQERRPLQQTIHILLECILVFFQFMLLKFFSSFLLANDQFK